MTPRIPTFVLLAAGATLGPVSGGSGVAGGGEPGAIERVTIARPRCSVELRAGANLDRELAQVSDGAVVCLAPGGYAGPLRIARKVVLWGPPDAEIRSSGAGTTVEVSASGTQLLGFGVDGSGGRFDTLDAAVRIEADNVRVEGIAIRRAVFGLLVEKSRAVTLSKNLIHGTEEGPLGLRGDPIRLWETRDSLVDGNRVIAGRDVVIWYSSGNRITDNVVSSGRYGTHLMYSHDNDVIGNRYDANVVGSFVMYSRNVRLENNTFVHSKGAAGVGLGLKESGNIRVLGNVFLNNTIGTYIDTSPMNRADRNIFERNALVMNDRAVIFHGREHGNTFTDNVLRDNDVQVHVEGNSDSSGTRWQGNYFDDYVGYDLDDDGIGDVPYELRSLAADLVARHPDLQLLRGTPALWLVDAMAHIAPLYKPRTLCVDRAPRLRPPLGVDPGRGARR